MKPTELTQFEIDAKINKSVKRLTGNFLSSKCPTHGVVKPFFDRISNSYVCCICLSDNLIQPVVVPGDENY